MDKKFIRNFFLGMMVLSILIFGEVQAIGIYSASFLPSSSPISPLSLSILARIHHQFHACFTKELQNCWLKHDISNREEFGMCALWSLDQSMKHKSNPRDPDHEIVKKCKSHCSEKEKNIHAYLRGLCLVECYESNSKIRL